MCHLGHNKAGFSKRSDTRHEQYIFLSPTFPPWTRKLISSHCFSSSFFFRFSLHELNWRRDSQINSLSLPGKPWLQPDRPNPHGQIYPQLLLICTVFSHLLQELDFFLSSSVGPGNTSRTMQSVYPPPPPPPPASCNTFIHYFCFEWLHHVQLCPSQNRSHSR